MEDWVELSELAEKIAGLAVRLRIRGRQVEAMDLERWVQDLAGSLAMMRPDRQGRGQEGENSGFTTWQPTAPEGAEDLGDVRSPASLADRLGRLLGSAR